MNDIDYSISVTAPVAPDKVIGTIDGRARSGSNDLLDALATAIKTFGTWATYIVKVTVVKDK